MTEEHNPFSGNADYWWYRTRAKQLKSFFSRNVSADDLVLDVGSSDGPSTHFVQDILARGAGKRIAMDIAPEGLGEEDILGSVEEIPRDDATFTIVSAFDVLEHVKNEAQGLDEMYRVLKPGGQLFISVPAYQWAWSKHDEKIHHYRRYTRGRLEAAVHQAGFHDVESSYGFFGVFPIFAVQRVLAKLKRQWAGETPEVTQEQEKLLLGLSRIDELALERGITLPWGSSVLLKARKPL